MFSCPSSSYQNTQIKISRKEVLQKKMEPLNSETSVENISTRLAVAEDYRNNATLRCDVIQTSDTKALSKMNDYIKEETDILDLHKDSEVAAFYAGRSILITGASGFVGKVSFKRETGCVRQQLL